MSDRGGRSTSIVIGGAVYVVVMVAIAALAAWPIYRSREFIVLVLVCTAVAVGIAAWASWRRLGGWAIAGLLLAGVFAVGAALAVPSRWSRGPLVVLSDIATGLALGWKDLLTVELPVGSYRNLLVPAAAVFLVGTCVALISAWRQDRRSYAAPFVTLAMVAFGLLFGRTSVSSPIGIGPVTITAPIETAVGVCALVASVLWLAWRSRAVRVRALRQAAVRSGVRVRRRSSRADGRRFLLGLGMIAAAVLVVVAFVPTAVEARERTVLRSDIGPEIDFAPERSPLSEYRSLFAVGRFDDVLFRVDGDALPDRLRLATLTDYDGETYRSESARFVRMPASRDTGAGTTTAVSVDIEQLGGIWMPTASELASVRFHGARSSVLADAFYYSRADGAGVLTVPGGLQPGDAYELRAVQPATPALSAVRATGTTDANIPESLRTWVQRHATGSDGAALSALVALLRERGYLSHALTIDAAAASWMQDMPGYLFQPSAAGHSVARIGSMFERLLEREDDPTAVSTDNYVAAIGDDEQFAVAASMVARELGFPARVVLGVRLNADDTNLVACRSGVCRAGDVAAWTEIRTPEGIWIPIDATPQAVQAPSIEVTQQQDPRNVTEVIADTVEEVDSPRPQKQDTAENTGDEPIPDDQLSQWWPTVRLAAIAVLIMLILFGPLLIILAAKALRRRRRRRREPVASIAAGWEEYLDAAVDAGREVPPSQTRTELANTLTTPAATALAVAADRAVFSGESIDDDDARGFWRSVDTDRKVFGRGGGILHRAGTALSLRSFLRTDRVSGGRGSHRRKGAASTATGGRDQS